MVSIRMNETVESELKEIAKSKDLYDLKIGTDALEEYKKTHYFYHG